MSFWARWPKIFWHCFPQNTAGSNGLAQAEGMWQERQLVCWARVIAEWRAYQCCFWSDPSNSLVRKFAWSSGEMPLKNLTLTAPAPIFRFLDQERAAINGAAAEGAITQKLSGKRTGRERWMCRLRLSILWRAVVAKPNYPPKGRAGSFP